MNFLPTTKNEINKLGWDQPDIILVSGDSYIDSPYIGAAVIGRVLEREGYRVAIIAQPDIDSDRDITRLGSPRLFWGVTSGSVDSMVANYTATGKKRKSDDYTPGGLNNRRPDRAVIVYSNLIRRYFKRDSSPIVLGGIEASLRRISHFDYITNRIRRSILFDSKANLLVYGMGERSITALADAISRKSDYRNIRGLCYISKEKRDDYIELPPYEQVISDRNSHIECFRMFYNNNDPLTATGLVQRHGDRYLVHNPPSLSLTEKEMDRIYDLDFQRDLHPFYRKDGNVRALDTIRFSVTTHRGCYGECNFCAIAVHEGRTVQSRSPESVLKEVKRMTEHSKFKGYIQDVGGPTANMYGFECRKKIEKGSCLNRRCLYPDICSSLKPDHSKILDLLKKIRKIPGIKKAFVASGIRYDLLFKDHVNCSNYLKEIALHHVSGQLKVAPEHSVQKVLDLMGKPDTDSLIEFKKLFDRYSKEASKNQYLTYYFIAAHPGCTLNDMSRLKNFVRINLNIRPEQVQIFTPTPSTWSTLMYCTEINPFTNNKLFVEKGFKEKTRQKLFLVE